MQVSSRNILKNVGSAVSLIGVGMSLASCSGIAGLDSINPTPPAVIATQAPTNAAPVSGTTLGTGSVKVGLILPLSSPNGAVAASGLKNAAELALSEFQSQDVTLLVKDDLGTADGAAAATRQAIAEGAELIIGPLFANSVQSASRVAQGSGKSMIAFSSDEAVASRNIYLLSFTPQADVERITSYALEKGKKSFAILAPDSIYGNVAVQNFEQKVKQAGGRVVATERYNGSAVTAAAQRLKASITGADALFIPEDAVNLPSVAQALSSSGIDLSKLMVLGTSIWNQPSAFKISQFQGAVFPAPESTGFDSFAKRYKAKFGQNPVRIATLGFDATALVAALTKTQGANRFQENVLTNASGFSGQDGVFRFRSDGTNDRALAVFQIGLGRVSSVSAAPKGFAK